MNLLLPLLFIFIGFFCIFDPERAYQLNVRLVEGYAKMVKKIPVLNIMAEATVESNKSLDLSLVKSFGVFVMLIGSIVLLTSLY